MLQRKIWTTDKGFFEREGKCDSEVLTVFSFKISLLRVVTQTSSIVVDRYGCLGETHIPYRAVSYLKNFLIPTATTDQWFSVDVS